jgi:hypothetical protein
LPDSKAWVLRKEVSYDVGKERSGETITVPAAYGTDGESGLQNQILKAEKGKVCLASTPNEALFVGPDLLLEWRAGYGANQHDVYMSTSWNDVNGAVSERENTEQQRTGSDCLIVRLSFIHHI